MKKKEISLINLIKNNQYDKCINLIQKNDSSIDVNEVDNEEVPLIEYALKFGTPELIISLINAKNIDLDVKCSDGNPSIFHMIDDKMKNYYITYAINAGANLSVMNNQEITPLMYAVQNEKALLASIMIYSDRNIDENEKEIANNYIDSKKLIALITDKEKSENTKMAELENLIDSCDFNPKEHDEKGKTILMYLAEHNYLDHLKAFLKKIKLFQITGKSERDIKDNIGLLFNQKLSLKDEKEEIRDLVKDLQNLSLINEISNTYKRELNEMINLDQKDYFGNNASIYAAKAGNILAVQILISEGSDPEIKDANYKDIFYHLDQNKNDLISMLKNEEDINKSLEQCLDLIKSGKSNPNEVDKNGKTVFMYIVENIKNDYLMKQFFNVVNSGIYIEYDARNNSDMTALDYAEKLPAQESFIISNFLINQKKMQEIKQGNISIFRKYLTKNLIKNSSFEENEKKKRLAKSKEFFGFSSDDEDDQMKGRNNDELKESSRSPSPSGSRRGFENSYFDENGKKRRLGRERDFFAFSPDTEDNRVKRANNDESKESRRSRSPSRSRRGFNMK